MGVSLVVLVCVFPPWCGYACFSPWYVRFPRGGGTGVSPVVCVFSPWWGYGGFPRGMCVFPVVGVRGFPPSNKIEVQKKRIV